MGIKFTNNASTNITHALAADATSVSVTSGTGALFPSIIEGKDYFYATLAGNNGLEIVKVTKRVLDTMTIERAQDGTVSLSFNKGDLFELRIVAADFEDTFSNVETTLENTVKQINSTVASSLASLDASAVHKSGDETVSGTKTFTNNIVMSLAAPQLQIKQTDADRNVKPSTDQYAQMRFLDKNNDMMGALVNQQMTNGKTTTYISAYGPAGKSASLGVTYNEDGSAYASAPSTPAEASNNHVVTVDYLKSTNSGVVHNTGDETIAGMKTFNDNVYVKKNIPLFCAVDNSFSIGSNPRSDKFWAVEFQDKNDVWHGRVQHYAKTSGEASTTIGCKSNDGSVTGTMGVYIDAKGEVSGFAPSTPAGSTGNKVVTVDYLRSTNSGVVHTTGSETITGKKTFSSVEIKSPSSPELTLINTDINTGVNPAQSEYNVIRFEDADGTSLGVLAHQSYNSGAARTYFTCTSRVGGATGSVDIVAPADGSAPYVVAPSTPAGSAGNQIVTADFLQSKSVLVESWYSGTSWYRKYSDGWIEQGDTSEGDIKDMTVTLHKPFSDTNYTLVGPGFVIEGHGRQTVQKEKTYFIVGSASEHCGVKSWYACGY